MKRLKSWLKSLLQAGPEDEKLVLAVKIAEKFSLETLRLLLKATGKNPDVTNYDAEKWDLMKKIGDKLSIADMRKLANENAHVHKSPGKRRPKMTEAEIERLKGMANVENPLGAGIGAGNSFPYSAPDAESDKAAKEGAFGV